MKSCIIVGLDQVSWWSPIKEEFVSPYWFVRSLIFVRKHTTSYAFVLHNGFQGGFQASLAQPLNHGSDRITISLRSPENYCKRKNHPQHPEHCKESDWTMKRHLKIFTRRWRCLDSYNSVLKEGEECCKDVEGLFAGMPSHLSDKSRCVVHQRPFGTAEVCWLNVLSAAIYTITNTKGKWFLS